MKIVKNVCFGGFGLSNEACEWLIKNKGWKCGEWENGYFPKGVHLVKTEWNDYAINEAIVIGSEKHIGSENIKFRSHPDLISVVEELGEEANGRCADLKIVDVPDGLDLEITEYDGVESIEESHNSW